MRNEKCNGIRWTIAALVGMLLTLSAARVDAGFVSGFTGFNDFTAPSAVADGNVNFAVYDNDANDFFNNTSPGLAVLLDSQLGGSIVDGTPVGRFIYLYQAVNSNPVGGTNPLNEFKIFFETSSVQTLGYFTTTVFNEDDDGPTGPTTNQRLNEPLASDPLVTDAAAKKATAGDITEGIASWFFLGSDVLNHLQYSTVLFLTSDLEPVFRTGQLDDTGLTQNDVPAPAPAPPALALLLAGVPGIALAWRRRKQLNLTA